MNPLSNYFETCSFLNRASINYGAAGDLMDNGDPSFKFRRIARMTQRTLILPKLLCYLIGDDA